MIMNGEVNHTGSQQRATRRDEAGVIDAKDGPAVSAEQIKIAQESWKVVADKSHENGVILMKRLLNEHPGELIPLFSFSKVALSREKMFQEPAFFRHCCNVMNTLDVAISGLDDLEALVPVLEKLGKRHKTRNVKTAHFECLQEAFVFMLRNALGDSLTTEVLDAWRAVFAVVAATMGSKM